MTQLGRILREQKATYTTVAERAGVQARTVRLIATGDTPIDSVAVGTVRKIAEALAVPVSALLEPDPPAPGDASLARTTRLSAAIRAVMWPATQAPYLSPAEPGEPDEMAAVSPDDFFADMPRIDAGRG